MTRPTAVTATDRDVNSTATSIAAHQMSVKSKQCLGLIVVVKLLSYCKN